MCLPACVNHRRQGGGYRLQHGGRTLLRGRAEIPRHPRPVDFLHRGLQANRSFRYLRLFRGRHTYVGIDTLSLSSNRHRRCAAGITARLLPWSPDAFTIVDRAIYALGDAKAAYEAVWALRGIGWFLPAERVTHERHPFSDAKPYEGLAITRLRMIRLQGRESRSATICGWA